MAEITDAIKKANPTLFSLPTDADKARNAQYNLDPRYVVQTDYGKVPGKQVVGVGVYKHPVLGYTYEYDIYSDGTNSLSEFFKSIGGEEKIKEYVPTVGYRDLNRPGFRLLSISRLLDEGSGTPSVVTGSSSSAVSAPYTATDGTKFTDQAAFTNYQKMLNETAAAKEKDLTARLSAFQILKEEFDRYGLGALVEPLKGLVEQNISPSEFTLRLRDTDAYKKRFAANAQRINKGLRALSEAEYITLEDQYQNVMRNYGLPASYYQRGEMGVQQGFEKFIAGDVSPTELEDRIQTAQNRVINAAPEVSRALREFYPDITDGDILAYTLDPEQALTNIKRKVTAAEIGAGALQAGLATGLTRAEELQRYGVTGEAARQGYQAIAGYLPRTSTLGDIYAKQGMGPFTQATAEAETFGTPGATEAAQKRRKLSELEQAQFSGQVGRAGGALARERAGQF